MRTEDLVGTWILESFVAKSASGAQALPFGESPRGFLTYTGGGYMAAVLMRSGRAKFASRDLRGGTPEEVKEAFDGFDAYAGPFSFDAQTGTVTHSAEVARLPNWEGTPQVRFAQLVDGRLELSTPPVLVAGQEWVSNVRWRRAGIE